MCYREKLIWVRAFHLADPGPSPASQPGSSACSQQLPLLIAVNLCFFLPLPDVDLGTVSPEVLANAWELLIPGGVLPVRPREAEARSWKPKQPSRRLQMLVLPNLLGN